MRRLNYTWNLNFCIVDANIERLCYKEIRQKIYFNNPKRDNLLILTTLDLRYIL